MPVVLAIFTTQPFTLEKLKYLIISIIVLKLIEIILNHFWVVYILRFENKYSKDLQLAYFNRISKMKPTKLNKVHNGFLKKQIDIISDESAQFMEYSFETLNGFSISIIIFLIEVINQDVNMFIVCLFMVICMIFYNVWLGKKYVAVQEKYNESFSKYNSTYVDFLQNIKTVKRLNATKYANRKNEEAFREVIPKLDKTNFFYSLRSNGISFFVYSMYAIILINLYFKMKNGQDILSYLLFYATMFSGLTTELKDLSRLFMHYNKFQAATNQVEKIIGEEENLDVINNWNKIEIKDLDFRYGDESKNTIKIPYFELKKGDKVSIVGKSGQGKTTFLNILSRYFDIEKEKYVIDGISQDGNLDLAYISQEVELFDLSIKDNLCLGKNIEESILMKYLKEAGLEEWAEKLENGLDTVVGERGLKLSVGQKQRLNIIRGILLDKEIYILDEPTSNLDKETEKLIINLIQKYLKDKTVVIVTHRDEIREICNRHYEFKNNIMKECELK
jgi:ATP-binding cassette subfamily B protein/subfamily B ATP-binding cassette protein MsbA